ncbi:TPA: hypothetical protein L8R65_000001, partial [Klebsiella pneumoniae]|nr:hypothetical protein [Klebsiella pneumoniae]
MDHYIPTGKMIEDALDGSFFDIFENRYGELPINKNRIYYMTIDEFEFMIEVCRNKNISITSIIDSCSDNDAIKSSQKFNVMMHLHKLSPEGISDRRLIAENRDYLFDDLINSIQETASVWDGRVEEYFAIR